MINQIKDILLIFGIMYAIFEYFISRKNKAKTENDLDVIIYDLNENKYLIDIQIGITNKSMVRKYINNIILSVKTLTDQDIQQSIGSKKMLRFTNKIIHKYKDKNIKNNILEEYSRKSKGLDFWVDPNTTEIFSYPVVIESSDKFVQINIEYPMGKSGKKYFTKILNLKEIIK